MKSKFTVSHIILLRKIEYKLYIFNKNSLINYLHRFDIKFKYIICFGSYFLFLEITIYYLHMFIYYIVCGDFVWGGTCKFTPCNVYYSSP